MSPVESLERYFRIGGTTILRAAFEHSYFVHPDRVRRNTPLYPDRARLSREHYPKLDRGAHGIWQGREVRLGDNSKAQHALGALYPDAGSSALPATAFATSGDTLGIRTRSPPDGTSATCPSGPAC